jgi:hypothetical protein
MQANVPAGGQTPNAQTPPNAAPNASNPQVAKNQDK